MSLTKEINSPELDDIFSGVPLKSLIGGEWVDAEDGATLITRDPGTGNEIAEVPALGTADVDRAVQSADEAFRTSGWPEMSPQERGVLLHRLADAVEQHKNQLTHIEAIDAGKILSQAEGDVQNLADTIRYFVDLSLHLPRSTPLAVAGHEAKVVRFPWGPCGFIFPWNFPTLLMGWNIAPALAAGNTVVIKPAEDTPLTAIYLAKLAQEVGIPQGVINVVTGHGGVAGAALANHQSLKRMSFTGSPEVGRLIGEACGRNLTPVKLELGGKGAAVVFDDVDIEATADKLVAAITFHSGQVCCDATRWLVQKPIYNRLVDSCAKRLQNVNVGYQMETETDMGPLVSSKQRDRVLGYLERAESEGAEVVLEGGAATVPGREGFYVKPALLAGSLDNVAAREEIFGPVAFLAPFTDENEALEMVNGTDYGLANSVWTSDLKRADRVAEQMVAGNSWINAHNVFPHGVSYAGINKSGIGGGVMSVETLMDYTRSLSVVKPL